MSCLRHARVVSPFCYIRALFVVAGQEDGVVYRASDVPKRTVLAPIVNGTNVQSKSPGAALGNGYRRGSSWVWNIICRSCSLAISCTEIFSLDFGSLFGLEAGLSPLEPLA